MHELGITQAIVDIVAEASRGQRVLRVVLEVGVLAGVMADSIAFCFEVVAQETPLQGARLEVVKVDGVGRCRACAAELPISEPYGECGCGSRDIELLRGGELRVRSIEIEDTERIGADHGVF